MDRVQADLLVVELGKQVGIPDMALNTAGNCMLSIDGGAVVIVISHDGVSGALDFSSTLDQIQPSAARLTRALSANFCWRPVDGAIFSFDRTSGRLVLRRRWPGGDLASLRSALESFVRHCMAWTKLLGETREIEEQPASLDTVPRMPIGVRA